MGTLSFFAKTVIAGLLAGASFIGLHEATVIEPSRVLGSYNTAAGGTYRLQTSLGTSDTTIRLSSFTDPRNGYAISMAYLNTSVAYGTLDPQQGSRSELVSFTGVTQNADGTASLTGVTRGLSGVYPYTASSTLRKTHAGQSIFILSDAPQVFNEYGAKQNDETITGSWTFSGTTTMSKAGTTTFVGPVTFNSSTTHVGISSFNATTTFFHASTSYACDGLSPLSSVCSKSYIDGVATSGAPDASTIQKGVVEEATAAELAAGTAAGATGARLFVNPSTIASSTIPGLIATTTQYASSTFTVGTTTIFTITSTTSTQYINIWVKGRTASVGSAAYALSFVDSSGATTTLDELISSGDSAVTRVPYSLIATYRPTKTGSVVFWSNAESAYFRAIMTTIR